MYRSFVFPVKLHSIGTNFEISEDKIMENFSLVNFLCLIHPVGTCALLSTLDPVASHKMKPKFYVKKVLNHARRQRFFLLINKQSSQNINNVSYVINPKICLCSVHSYFFFHSKQSG